MTYTELPQILKVIFGFLFVFLERDTQQFDGWTLKESLACAGLPAIIYALQNILLQVRAHYPA
jgi:ABC-type uncharacterized transport system permease subunit